MDEQKLRLAIGEIIAKENGWDFRISGPVGDGPHWLISQEKAGHYDVKYIPNWPEDIAAAIELAPTDKDFMLFRDRVDDTWEALCGMQIRGGRCKTPAEAICMLFLKAKKKEQRKDGRDGEG